MENWRAEEAVAGSGRALEALRELIIYPFLYAKESRKLGLKWPRGLLLYGPPGTGKTTLVHAVARECNAHLTMINPYSVHRAHAGESEKFLREAFSQAHSKASSGNPSIIFIDEIDAICPRRNNRKELESRIVGQLLTLMDGSRTLSKSLLHVVVVASTNRVDGIDPALRRPGRFDSEIEVSVPTAEERFEILKLHAKNVHLDCDVDLQAIAASCNGYVGADLEALCREAARFAYRRTSDAAKHDSEIKLGREDWECARAEVGPSMTRGVTKEFKKITWDDIGGLKDLKKKLQQAVEWPIKHADAFARLGISPIRGILLHGPPGCSKTTLAKAAAHAAQASFFSLSGAELYSKYVGEGEALLRRTFQKARLAAPSIVFFDEADAIAPKRRWMYCGGVEDASLPLKRSSRGGQLSYRVSTFFLLFIFCFLSSSFSRLLSLRSAIARRRLLSRRRPHCFRITMWVFDVSWRNRLCLLTMELEVVDLYNAAKSGDMTYLRRSWSDGKVDMDLGFGNKAMHVSLLHGHLVFAMFILGRFIQNKVVYNDQWVETLLLSKNSLQMTPLHLAISNKANHRFILYVSEEFLVRSSDEFKKAVVADVSLLYCAIESGNLVGI